ncbi:MAG: Spx/MgsR family RNA polymerase-binding regulatory protein [Pseudomonadales bacterium]|jgi:Spx/MgsR family transcriptional regulator|nr:Spx/MgsR family RNA polymerase-binding regulatory protein [Pseudomonadales bacterium]
MITLYGIANCDTIRKTRKWLQEKGSDYDFHDYKKQGCPPELAATLLQQFDLDTVINKRGSTWRKLPESRRDSLTVDNAAELMQEQPSVIKRPILNIDGQWLLGYDSARMEELIN